MAAGQTRSGPVWQHRGFSGQKLLPRHRFTFRRTTTSPIGSSASAPLAGQGPSLCRLPVPPFPSSEGHRRPGPSGRAPLEVGGLGVVPCDPEHRVVMEGVDCLPAQAQWATHLQRSRAPPKGALTAFLINSPNSPVLVRDSYRGESRAANRWGC